jgi:hypothetical protein
MEVDAQSLLGKGGQFVAAHGLAGFGLADLDDLATGRRLSEIVVERDDAVDFGAGKIQLGSDDRNRFGRDETDVVLNGMQNGQQGPGLGLVFGNRGGDGLLMMVLRRHDVIAGRSRPHSERFPWIAWTHTANTERAVIPQDSWPAQLEKYRPVERGRQCKNRVFLPVVAEGFSLSQLGFRGIGL